MHEQDIKIILQKLSKNAEKISKFSEDIGPIEDIIIAAAFLEAAIEVQAPASVGLFDELRFLFRRTYPLMLKNSGITLTPGEVSLMVPKFPDLDEECAPVVATYTDLVN